MQLLIDWVLAHQVVLASFVVAVLDLAFALKPDWESSGILHWIWLQVKKIAGK